MGEYLFGYGSLRTGLTNAEAAGLVGQLRSVGLARLPGRLYDLGEYSGAALGDASGAMIVGEVFELPDGQALLAALDAYEGYDPATPEAGLFRRVESLARLADGRELKCWVYVPHRIPATAALIAGGDYAVWQAAKRGGEKKDD